MRDEFSLDPNRRDGNSGTLRLFAKQMNAELFLRKHDEGNCNPKYPGPANQEMQITVLLDVPEQKKPQNLPTNEPVTY